MTDKTPVPTEEAEQRSLMQWVAYSRGSCPELIKLYHIPNEGKRHNCREQDSKQQV